MPLHHLLAFRGCTGAARSLGKEPGKRGHESSRAPTNTILVALGTLCPSDALPLALVTQPLPGSLPLLWLLLLRLFGGFLFSEERNVKVPQSPTLGPSSSLCTHPICTHVHLIHLPHPSKSQRHLRPRGSKTAFIFYFLLHNLRKVA